MRHPIDVWHKEHVNFDKLLAILDCQLAALHAAERPDYELMRDVVYYLHEYADRYHHPREDKAFARLQARDPSLELPIARLEQEHRVIAAAGEKVREGLEQILEDGVLPREALEMSLAMYVTFYRHHLNTEEVNIMPRARALLTPSDWDAINAALPSAPDPLFGDKPHARFEALSLALAECSV